MGQAPADTQALLPAASPADDDWRMHHCQADLDEGGRDGLLSERSPHERPQRRAAMTAGGGFRVFVDL